MRVSRNGNLKETINLLIDKAILKNSKKRHILALALSDYRKVYDMRIPHSWIVKCLEIFEIAENVKRLFY